MNGVFDLGGTDGLGPVAVVEDEPIFRAEWEKPMFTMFSACFRAGFFGVDSFRHGIEKMDPATYLKAPYYEHWLFTIENASIAAGAVDPEELDRRTEYYLKNPDAPLPEHEQSQELIDFVNAVVPAGAPAARETDKVARFSVGDVARVIDVSPYGHTRRARYVRGKVGTVIAHHGSFIYPDTAGNGLGENPEHVYTLKFTAEELWGAEAADPNGTVCFDVWDPYLELITEGA
ncbi:nitrile hydratase subunit beta [Gordonia polyisoprenivorans]|uniref:nitrile hydratase subunit beta n=1 Tax=Gordonia polyisoprenivorans TaxID=84595 RepID=UPI001AD65451|nr:nitrile hydratase subunit beta [Gordonia polyisoprenivorans]QTI69078.1 nitrile hydratase subunit beta [Gordonia polyisoprenivorans]